MVINKTCRLVQTDLHFYDVRSAYPTLLKSIGWNLKDKSRTKEEINKYIGTLQRNNRKLTDYLQNQISGLLEYYKHINKIKNEEIILEQKDGLVINRYIDNYSGPIKLDYRGTFDVFIISPDRKKFIATYNNICVVRGVKYTYENLNVVYNKYFRLNFYNKKILFSQLEEIKNYVMSNDDKELFVIDRDGKKYIYSNIGPMVIHDMNLFVIDDIKKIQYYNHYYKEFSNSLFLEFYNG